MSGLRSILLVISIGLGPLGALAQSCPCCPEDSESSFKQEARCCKKTPAKGTPFAIKIEYLKPCCCQLLNPPPNETIRPPNWILQYHDKIQSLDSSIRAQDTPSLVSVCVTDPRILTSAPDPQLLYCIRTE